MNTPAPVIYLASQSPRRKELLQQIGVAYRVIPIDINEIRQPNEKPAAMALRLAQEKAQAGWAALQTRPTNQASHWPPLPILAGDTLVELEGDVLGKPINDLDAQAMLARMVGKTHCVHSAVAMTDGQKTQGLLNSSNVTFAELNQKQIQHYVASGESKGRAGSYGVQGAGALFIQRIEGSYSGVMGLPLYETGQLLRQFSIIGAAQS